jgi:hypothetical protein
MALGAAAHEPPIGDRVKSVRDYIDETPVWPDGTTLASDDGDAVAHLVARGRGASSSRGSSFL